MTVRLATSAQEIAAAERVLRRSLRPDTVAAMLDMDRSQVYKLIKSAELETHAIGKRGVRVYLDSVEAYRERGRGVQARPAAPKPRQRLGGEFYEACARLRAVGVLRR